MAAWTVAAAKAKLSELIDRAQVDGPQIITRRGRKAVIVVAASQWEKKQDRDGNLAEFFSRSPMRGSDLQIDRLPGGLRDSGL